MIVLHAHDALEKFIKHVMMVHGKEKIPDDPRKISKGQSTTPRSTQHSWCLMSTLGLNFRCVGPNFLAWVFCLVNPWSNFGEHADSCYPFDGCQRPNTGKPLSLLRELSWCLHYPNIFHTWLLAKMFLPLLPPHRNKTPCSLRLPLVAARAGPGDVWALVSWRREVDLPWAERNWRLPPDLKVSCTIGVNCPIRESEKSSFPCSG